MPDLSPTPAGRRPIEVGRVIREALSIYSENVNALLGSALLIVVVPSLIQTILVGQGPVLEFIGTLIALTAAVLYTGFVVKLVEDVRDGRRDSTAQELISSATPFIVPLIANGFLRLLGIALGLVLFIVPGLYLLAIWAVCSPAIVAEEKGVIDAFRRSKDLVEGQKMAVFLTIVATALALIVVGAIVLGIGVAVAGTAGYVFVGMIFSAVTAPVFGLVTAVIFFDLGGGTAAPAADGQVVVEY